MKTQLRSLLAAALVAAVSLVGVGARPAEALTPLAGQPVNVSKKTGNQLEAAIAADPTNPSRVFVATNDETLNFKGLATARSSDGGATWTSGTVATGPTPGDGFTFACCDPSVSWDSFGNLFFAYLGFPGGTTQTVELLRSSDGGQTFSLVTQIASATGLDQPTVTTGAGEVWVTWKQGTIRARGASVTGLGTVGAFTAAATLGAGNFGDVAIGPAGQVVVTYQDNTGGQGLSNIFTQVDADGVGMGGFSAAVAATTTNVGGFDYIPPQPDRSVDAEAGLAFDRTGGTNNGRLYLVYTDEAPDESNDTNIFVRTSPDSGATWTAPVRVNEDATTNSQFLPKLALDQSTGNIGVSFHDARLDVGSVVTAENLDGVANTNAHLFAAISTDGGATFLPNVKVSRAPSAENGAEPPAPGYVDSDYGDFTGATFVAGTFRPAWADNSNSTGDNPDGTLNRFDVYTAAVTLPPETTCAAPPPPPPGAIIASPGVTTNGTPGNDIIYGTSGPDQIFGGGGNDTIYGLGGNDQISGGDGNDILCGGAGDDKIAGGNGNDTLSADSGNDDLSGTAGDDRLVGGAGSGPGGLVRESGGVGFDTCIVATSGTTQQAGCESTGP